MRHIARRTKTWITSMQTVPGTIANGYQPPRTTAQGAGDSQWSCCRLRVGSYHDDFWIRHTPLTQINSIVRPPSSLCGTKMLGAGRTDNRITTSGRSSAPTAGSLLLTQQLGQLGDISSGHPPRLKGRSRIDHDPRAIIHVQPVPTKASLFAASQPQDAEPQNDKALMRGTCLTAACW